MSNFFSPAHYKAAQDPTTASRRRRSVSCGLLQSKIQNRKEQQNPSLVAAALLSTNFKNPFLSSFLHLIPHVLRRAAARRRRRRRRHCRLLHVLLVYASPPPPLLLGGKGSLSPTYYLSCFPCVSARASRGSRPLVGLGGGVDSGRFGERAGAVGG